MKIGMGVKGMNYNYSVDSKLYSDEINRFAKNSTVLKKNRKNGILAALIIVSIVMVISFLKRISDNYEPMNTLVVYLVMFIIVVIFIFILDRLYFKYCILNKVLLKYWKKEYVHGLKLKDDGCMYYITPENAYPAKVEIQINPMSLKEAKELDNIIVLSVFVRHSKYRKIKGTAMIIIPKSIFESEESLNKFKELLKG